MQHSDESPLNSVFKVLDVVPSQVWYILGISSVAASVILQVSGHKNGADFVGKWPPTLLLLGLYHKLLRPGDEDAVAQAKNVARKLQQAS